MSESLLVNRVREGDLSAWRQLIERDQEAVFRLAYLASADQIVAEDIAQQTFLRAFERLHTFDDRRSLRAWLFCLCWQLIEEQQAGRSRARRSIKRVLHLVSGGRNQPRQSPAQDKIWNAARARSSLPQRVAFLRFWLGCGLAEIAQAAEIKLTELRELIRVVTDDLYTRINTGSKATFGGGSAEQREKTEELVEIVSEFEFPAAPPISRYVLAEISGNSPYHFKSQPLRWTAAALIGSVSLVLIGSLFFGGNSTANEPIPVNTVRDRQSESADRYSPASAARRLEGEAMTSLSLAGATTLEEAQQNFPFPVLLPSALPPPDRIYLQDLPAAGLIMLWLDEGGNQEMALFQLTPSARNSQLEASIVGRPIVNGEPALWIEGAYAVMLDNGKLAWSRMEGGHLLVWSQGDLGLRLETKGTLSMALSVAESLQ